MYFLLYDPNLNSVFCGRTYKYIFFIFYSFVWLGYFRLGYFKLG